MVSLERSWEAWHRRESSSVLIWIFHHYSGLSPPPPASLHIFSLAQASVKYGIALDDSNNQKSLDFVLKFQPLEKVEHSGQFTLMFFGWILHGCGGALASVFFILSLSRPQICYTISTLLCPSGRRSFTTMCRHCGTTPASKRRFADPTNTSSWTAPSIIWNESRKSAPSATFPVTKTFCDAVSWPRRWIRDFELTLTWLSLSATEWNSVADCNSTPFDVVVVLIVVRVEIEKWITF